MRSWQGRWDWRQAETHLARAASMRCAGASVYSGGVTRSMWVEREDRQYLMWERSWATMGFG